VGSDAERARINVRRRIIDTVERIEAELPELGLYLRNTIKTGTFCVYRPQ